MGWPEETIANCRLILGDCREVLPTLARVDAVVTDPPYGVGLQGKRAHGGRGHGRYQQGDDRVRPGHYSHADSPEYVATVVIGVIEQCRNLAPSVVVTPGTRNLWLYPPADDVGCFYSASGTGRGHWGFTCMQPILFYGKDPYLRLGLGARSNSCGKFDPTDANTIDHPCAKPLAMMCWLVNRASLEGMTVLDPFMGAGTTGVACTQLGRAFIGIEIEPRYFDIACRRIEEAYRQPELFVRVATKPQQLSLRVG